MEPGILWLQDPEDSSGKGEMVDMRWVWCTMAHPVFSKDTGQMTEVGRAGHWLGKRQ